MELQQLCDIISSQMKLDKKIERTDCLSSDIGMCSFDMMVLIVELENACGHEINTMMIKNDMTVEEFLAVVNQ